MSKYLVIVESPGKIKTISNILKKDYQVLASMGHVRDLPTSADAVDLKTFKMTYEIPATKQKTVTQLRSAAKDKERVFLCSDPDREGEFIAASLAAILGVPEERLARATFNEITPKAVTAAIAAPRAIDKDLVDAQQARRCLDRIVGYKLSAYLWDKVRRGLSAGRVQSVAVRLIADREKEIQAFVPEEYWGIEGSFRRNAAAFKAPLRKIAAGPVARSAEDLHKDGVVTLDSEKKAAEAAGEALDGRAYRVSGFERKDAQERAWPPFATSTLQMSAASVLGFDAKRTMQVAQKLYEAGLISYMRTDSFNVSRDAQADAKEIIVSSHGAEYYPDKPNWYKSKSGAQQAHECIRPTHFDQPPDAADLQADEKNLYRMIWERFIASQMAPAVWDTRACDLAGGRGGACAFRATGRSLKFPGWRAAAGAAQEDARQLPDMEDGQEVLLQDVEQARKSTQPPPRFNDASLVKALESEGIGRPSTYASIIQTIQDRKYVEKNGRGGKASFRATDLGIAVTDILVESFPRLLDTKFTSQMEDTLDSIDEGEKTYFQVMDEFYGPFVRDLAEAAKRVPSIKGGSATETPCPKCGAKLRRLLGSLGFFHACPSEECGHTQDVDGTQRLAPATVPGLRCDKCGAGVVKASGRFGDYFACETSLNRSKSKGRTKGKKQAEQEKPVCDFTMKITKQGLPQRKGVALETGVQCPKCKAQMVVRVAGRKKNPAPFLSCSAYPRCRNAVPLPDDLQDKGEEAMEAFRLARKKDAADAKAMQDADQKQAADA